LPRAVQFFTPGAPMVYYVVGQKLEALNLKFQETIKIVL
jgi:hypothetical protein